MLSDGKTGLWRYIGWVCTGSREHWFLCLHVLESFLVSLAAGGETSHGYADMPGWPHLSWTSRQAVLLDLPYTIYHGGNG